MFTGRDVVIFILLIIVEINANEDGTSYNPRNLCVRLTTNTTALIQWVEPSMLRSEIHGYTIYYTRNLDYPLREWSKLKIGNNPMTTIRNFDLGQVYHFRIQVDSLGWNEPGPISHIYDFKMLNGARSCYDNPQSTTIHSLNVLRAAATSYTTVEVWWNFPYDPREIYGFQVFYGINGSNNWFNKTVGLTNSVDLTNLVEFAVYKIALAALTRSGLDLYSQETTVKVKPEDVPLDIRVYEITSNSVILDWSAPARLDPIQYKISYDAVKDFIDSEGIYQNYRLEKMEVLVDGDVRSHELLDLMPYTNYHINITAIPVDRSYRPSAKIKVKTEIAVPGSMKKPEFHKIINGDSVQLILPKASEENGPVSYYYIIVVPENEADIEIPTNVYKTEDLLENEWYEGEEVNTPYITAKFPSKIPYAFILGSGELGTFKNHKLNKYKRYRVFVRAVVITSRGNLFTDSPYSDYFSLSSQGDRSLW